MRLTGWGLGLIILIAGAFTSIWSIEFLMMNAIETGAVQYGELIGKHLRGWGTAFDTALSVYGFGVMIAYLVFLGDFIPSLAKQFLPSVTPLHHREIAMALTLIVAVPLSVPKRLSALRYCSVVASVSLVYTAALIIMRTTEYAPWVLNPAEYGEGISKYPVYIFSWKIFQAIGNFIFVYNCHLNVVPVASELSRPTPERIRKIANTSVTIQIIFYLFIAMCGYISFGDRKTNPDNPTKADILKNYENEDGLANIARLALTITLIFALPINLNPTLRSFLRVCDRTVKKWYKIKLGVSTLPEEVVVRRSHDFRYRRLLGACFYLFLALFVAVVWTNPSEIIGLMSASIGTLMMFVFPAFVNRATDKTSWKIKNVILYGFGVVQGFGTFVMLYQLVYPPPPDSDP
jgi:amino acid permease